MLIRLYEVKSRVYREPNTGKPTCTDPPACWRRPRSPTM